MVKLTITLPDCTQIALETDDYEMISRVIGMFMHSVAPGSASVEVNSSRDSDSEVEKSTDVNHEQPPAPHSSNGATDSPPAIGIVPQLPSQPPEVVPSSNGVSNSHASPASIPDEDGLSLELYDPAVRNDFVAFCQNLNPMGDMRRVVVAAEGAGRFFNVDGVTADELGELFDLVGWRRANSFTQTLRNAARSKFGWLERIPGRAGRYASTDHGRTVTMGG